MAITYSGGITIAGGITQTVLGVGGSTSYNGTTQYLSVPYNSALQITSGNFTIEFWVYFNSVASGQRLAGQDNTSSTLNWALYTNANGTLNYFLGSTGNIWNIALGTGVGVITTGLWYHVALVRNGTTFTPYLNGVAGGTTTNGDALYASTSPVTIGAAFVGISFFNGYISNFRIVKGTAVYTAQFTPPTQPLTSTQSANVNGTPSAAITGTSTSLLLNMPNNSSFLQDSSTNNLTVTNVASVPSSSLTPFNPGSILFNGTTQYLTLPNSSTSINISSGDFTVECWFNTNSISNGGLGQTLLYLGGNTSSYATVRLGLDTSGLAFYVSVNGISWSIISGVIGTVVSNTWNHVAVTRSTSTFKVYLNGTQVGTNYTQAGTLYAGTLNYIGALNYSAVVTNPYRLMNGYISNVRVVKDVAVYTANFTPPTQPLTSTQSANQNGVPSAAITGTNTGLLLNTQKGPAYLVDGSTNNLTVTNVGNATTQSSIPFSL